MRRDDPDSPELPRAVQPPHEHISLGAFLELVDRRGRELYRYFRLLGQDQHEADDSVQETFLRLHAYRGRIRAGEERGLGVLLYRIARNVWVDGLRRARSRPQLRPLETSAEPMRFAAAGGPSLEEALDARSALSRLPEKLRDVVLLCVFQGLSHREAAQALGIPIGTVKSRMLHAMARLREAFDVPSTR